MKNLQQTISLASQQLKQLKDDLRNFKKDRKILESNVNDIEKRYKQLKSKHQNLLKTLENNCTYWIMVEELLLKIQIKNNHINNFTLITPDADTLIDKNLESVLKHLKVNISNFLFREYSYIIDLF